MGYSTLDGFNSAPFFRACANLCGDGATNPIFFAGVAASRFARRGCRSLRGLIEAVAETEDGSIAAERKY